MTTQKSVVDRYDVAEGWGELPAGWEWGQVASVAVDANDNVYAYTRSAHPVMVFDREGHFLRSLGEGIIDDAHGLCVDESDLSLLLVDREAHVARKLSSDGRVLLQLGTPGVPSDTGWTPEGKTVLRAAGPFNYPTDVVLAADGGFYVSDGYRNVRIHRFDDDGSLLYSWGDVGNGAGQFNVPHGLFEHAGKVYVADRSNHRIQVFEPDGTYLREFTASDGGLNLPTKIHIDRDDIAYISELRGRVTICDLSGTVRERIGELNEPSREPGRFTAPHGICVDSRGDFYVAEVGEGERLQKFLRK